MTNREAVLTILEEAALFGVNRGEPQHLPPDGPQDGWVSGLYLAMHGGGLRFGGRIHELRHDFGCEIDVHEERGNDGTTHAFYRLVRGLALSGVEGPIGDESAGERMATRSPSRDGTSAMIPIDSSPVGPTTNENPSPPPSLLGKGVGGLGGPGVGLFPELRAAAPNRLLEAIER